jgi:hypothetical protein
MMLHLGQKVFIYSYPNNLDKFKVQNLRKTIPSLKFSILKFSA